MIQLLKKNDILSFMTFLLLLCWAMPIHSPAQVMPDYTGIRLLEDPARINPDPDKLRPIDAHKTVFMNEMTWLEIRDAMEEGKTTAIVMTGGLEMSGPYAVTDKHNIICHVVGERIARSLGNALIATIVPYVPQGSLDPPGGYVRYPGTLGVNELTFRALLTDIANNLRIQGFEHVLLLGDSGGNQTGMQYVAEQLAREWKSATIHYIPEYFGYEKWIRWAEKHGITETSEGIHDLFRDTAVLMLADPEYVRASARIEKGLFTINGVPLWPIEETLKTANELVDYQVSLTVNAIQHTLRSNQN